MTLTDFARTILEGTTLAEKLLTVEVEARDFWAPLTAEYQLPACPGREKKIQISPRGQKQQKFPSLNQLQSGQSRIIGQALHFFANHELLAIEMGAAALLLYPHDNQEEKNFKKGLLSTLKDEQKHLALYLHRMKHLGVELGDYPLNGFFWEKMSLLKRPEQYLAVMALTFESANLDFARYYASVFRNIGDLPTAATLETVYEDEIRHVSLGRKWLNAWKGEKDLWDYFTGLLPFPLTPARAKGIHYFPPSRLAAGLPPSFVDHLGAYQDTFKVTNRKSWNHP